MKGQKLLKVTSILMIIGGVIAAIVGVLAILGISALVALAESAEGTGLLYASSAIIIVSSIIEFIAGIKGVGACSAPQKAGRLCQVGHSHRYFVHCLHGYRTYRRRAVQHYQSGTQSAAAGPVFLWRGADEK